MLYSDFEVSVTEFVMSCHVMSCHVMKVNIAEVNPDMAEDKDDFLFWLETRTMFYFG